MTDAPPVHQAPPDPEARAQGWRLMAPPLLFIAQFGLAYGWVGLACAFGWQSIRWGPLQLVPAGVLLITVVALLALALARPRNVTAVAPLQDDAYAPEQRGAFMAQVTRMLGWLSAVAMLAVTAMTWLANTCAVSP